MVARYGALEPKLDATQLLARCGTDELERSAAAAARLTQQMVRMARLGRSILNELADPAAAPKIWQHLPEGDAHDPRSGYRYYYHCHPGHGATRAEHGHFHVFADADRAGGVTHLAAIGVDAHGLPLRLFTTNRWITDECWKPAGKVLDLIDGFVLRAPQGLKRVHAWLSALLQVFRPQLRWLLRARDQRLRELRGGQPRPGLFDDRRVTILSQFHVSLAQQAVALDALTARA
ncbi:hypothetical protein E4T66_00915 [Sinimarinibacterium sp. CAU 1509]|uniref:DUF6969 family protein n=1 Tax=Sinimarinibacterium sp. CAU 1509 TaxID=2562283 RepID=UPI0010ADA0CA|nr:hypothetical protein [Sinimarinibacterium sp. CAU 1509]TJY64834.1 hypothetical protein E4T66_00915 [Sinimarinibacterium sp. CAU 1509]